MKLVFSLVRFFVLTKVYGATGDSAEAEVVAEFTPEPHHEAFEGVLNGGIIGTLLDCHSNWTAVWHLIRRDLLTEAPCCVTADFHVKLRRPTPAWRYHRPTRCAPVPHIHVLT